MPIPFDASDIPLDQALQDMAQVIQSRLQQEQRLQPAFVGIRTGGVWVAHKLIKHIAGEQGEGLEEPVGELDISFYRDDFTRLGLNPTVKPSSLPFATENRHIVLVDDVVLSGRTIRAAMNELFDFGRPASILLVTLVDMGRRELPIQPDVVGFSADLPGHQRVKLRGPAPLRLELVEKSES